MGHILGFLENPRLGLEHIEKGIALYDSRRHHVTGLGIGPDPGVVGLAVSAFSFGPVAILIAPVIGQPTRLRWHKN